MPAFQADNPANASKKIHGRCASCFFAHTLRYRCVQPASIANARARSKRLAHIPTHLADFAMLKQRCIAVGLFQFF